MTSFSSIGIQAGQPWRMRRSLWIYWRRGGAALILALPSGHSTPNPTKEPCPAPRLTSTEPCWSRSIYATWPKRWDGAISKDATKEFDIVAAIDVESAFFFFPPQIAMETGSSVEEVREEARGILEEMSQNLQLRFIRLMAYTFNKVFKRLFSSIFVNMEGLNRVRTKGLISTVF